jgi:hypothetical protein
VFSGFSQPLIGSFTIPIGNLVAALKEERDRETAELEKIVAFLKKVSSGEMVASYYAHKEQSPNDAEGAEEELEHIE